MRHSWIDRTVNVYTDTLLLDIAAAVESLPVLHAAADHELHASAHLGERPSDGRPVSPLWCLDAGDLREDSTPFTESLPSTVSAPKRRNLGPSLLDGSSSTAPKLAAQSLRAAASQRPLPIPLGYLFLHTPSYWQDEPGRQSMQVNYEMAGGRLQIERSTSSPTASDRLPEKLPM